MSQVRESLLRSRAYEHYLDKHPGPHTTYTLARTSWKAGKLTPDVAGPYPGGHGHCVRYSHAVAAGGIGGRESSRRLQQRHAAPSAGWSASPAPLLPSARGAWACPCPPPLPRPFRAWVVRPPRSPPSPSGGYVWRKVFSLRLPQFVHLQLFFSSDSRIHKFR